MKKHLLFLLLIFFCFASKADHINGYEMQLVNIKTGAGVSTDNYKWRLKVYRPTNSIPLPLSFSFTIYINGSNALAGNFNVSKINPQTFIKFPESDCFPKSSNNAIEVGIYESPSVNYSLFTNSNNYYVTSSQCCRSINISNIYGNSTTYGSTFTIDFPRLSVSSVGRYNTSPEFKNSPSFYYKIGSTYVIDWSAIDIDGDSLSYSMVMPFDANTTKPFASITYAAGFKSDSNIADGSPDFTINAKTGQVLYKPTKLGFYAINVKVDEYRKVSGVPIKIGTSYREFAFKVINEINNAPILTDNKIRSHIIRDTINFYDEYTLNLWGKDIAGDSLYMSVIPNLAPGENIFDPIVYGAKFGYFGAVQSGSAAQNLVLKGDSLLDGQFKWKPFCKNYRTEPYKVSFVLRDRNCADAKDDSLHVYLYLKKKPNSPPMFISPDTIMNNKVLKYYVKQNTWFQLDGDSIIKTYDQDSTQVVNLYCFASPNNPTISNYSFIPTPSPVNSFATFRVMYNCTSDTPYKYTIVAFDDDCLKKDTAYLNIEVYVLPEFVAEENICGVTVDTTSYQILIFWQRTEPTVSSYVLYKEDYATSNFDSIATIPASNLNAYIDINTIFGNYKLAAMNSCGTKSLKSDIANAVFLGSRVVNSDVVDLNWSPYLNAEQNDSFIVAVKTVFSMSYKEIARLPITQMQFTDSVFFQGLAYYRIEVKSNITCLSPNVYKPRIFSNRTRCDAESVSIYNNI